MDVARDGIAIYQAVDDELPEPQPKTPHAALEMAREYLEEWYPTATDFYDSANDALKRGKTKLAAFLMHQATERYYHCALLVCTFYSPHVHNLAFLRTQAEKIDRRLIEVWPREMKADRSRFEKLKEAYIKARYSKHYCISEDELLWLGSRVEALAAIVDAICTDRIAQLEETARAVG
jgi:HEPN domain-containing protein